MSAPDKAYSVSALAKINLYLHVTGKRDDGFHTLDSLIAFAGVGDTVCASPAADGLSLSICGDFCEGVPDGPDNLVLKAALALGEIAHIKNPKASIVLTKRLPVASGIGGGSADAAAALRALIALWEIKPCESALMKMALSLGADVPMCLAGRTAFVEGVGEKLSFAEPLPTAWLVLANPGVSVSTPEVFKKRRGPFSAPNPFRKKASDADDLAAMLAQRGNDLASAAIELAPPIADVLSKLEGLPQCLLARMSGSGATCFGLFSKQLQAEEAARSLSKHHPKWWVKAAPLRSDVF
jgi:4-diphosphocytidyl-2-C-methyl-D-erythritol kinase